MCLSERDYMPKLLPRLMNQTYARECRLYVEIVVVKDDENY
jgi:hypothetical protein